MTRGMIISEVIILRELLKPVQVVVVAVAEEVAVAAEAVEADVAVAEEAEADKRIGWIQKSTSTVMEVLFCMCSILMDIEFLHYRKMKDNLIPLEPFHNHIVLTEFFLQRKDWFLDLSDCPQFRHLNWQEL